jgi:hypothetical protein
MDAAVHAEKQKADGVAPQTQRDLPEQPLAAHWWVDREDQSDLERLGAVLCHQELQPMLLVHPKLGRKEDTAPSGQSTPASRLRMEAVEQGMAVRNTRTIS